MVLGYPGAEDPPPNQGQPPAPAPPPEPPRHHPQPAPPPAQPAPADKDTSMITDLFGENAKAIVSFAVTFGGQLLARTFAEGAPVFPEDWQGWLALIGGSLLAAGLVWLKGNTESVETLQKKLDQAAAKG